MIDAIVLAAGLSSRMGRPKPLVEIGGRPALARVLDALLDASFREPIVVLGTAADEIRAAIDLGSSRIVVNPAPQDGLSSSLRLGLAAVDRGALGAMVLLVDMPAIRSETIRRVADRAEAGDRLVAPSVGGARGFPVFIARDLFSELQETLAGDTGARAFLARRRDLLTTIDVADPGCFQDFDAPKDLEPLEDLERSTPCATSA